MSNPYSVSFGFCVGKAGFGNAYNVQVPSGTLGSAILIPLFGDQDANGKIYDGPFTSAFNQLSAFAVAMDIVVPVGSTLRTNVFNQTQNAYVGNNDIAAGSGGGNITGGSLSIAAGDKVYLALVDTAGSGFLIPRVQWKLN